MAKLKTKDEFITQSKNIHNDFFDYSKVEYINNNIEVIIICPNHGEFEQLPRSHSTGSGCRLCKFDSYKHKEKELEDKLKKILKSNFFFSINEYKNSKSIVTLSCSNHGNFEYSVSELLRDRVKILCKGCKKENDRKQGLKSALAKFKEVHGERYGYSKINYINNNHKISIICKDHETFLQTPKNHKKGKGCPKCNSSIGENRVRKFLESKNISFEEQKRFNKCKNKRTLPFDFFVPELNTLIEYQGIQHFRTLGNDFFGGKKAFIERQKRDEIKRKFCETNNINLILIRYDNDVEKILSQSILR